ncbi:MAG: ABC transporter substrate-binding protein [Candidatus Rifleibacteriota bacterium]
MRALFLALFLAFILLPVFAQDLEIIDSRGNSVLLPRLPERIVITGRAGFMISNLAFFFKSASSRLISYSRSLQFHNSDQFYQLLDSKFSEWPEINSHNNSVEELAALKPDLILAREVERNRLESGLKLLGLKAVFFDLEDPKVFFEEIENLGTIFGEPEKAQEVVNFFSGWQKRIAERLPVKTKPRVLHLFYSEREGPVSFSVSPPSWIQARIVKEAGGDPVWFDAGADRGWKKVGFEQIAAWNPDYIMVTSYFSDVEVSVARLKQDKLWQKLQAVSNGRLLAFPEDYICWDQPDSRWILGQCWLAMVLNPEVVELKSDMAEIFNQFFKLYNLSDDKIKEIQIRGDAGFAR